MESFIVLGTSIWKATPPCALGPFGSLRYVIWCRNFYFCTLFVQTYCFWGAYYSFSFPPPGVSL